MIEKIMWSFLAAILLYGVVMIAQGEVKPSLQACHGTKYDGPLCAVR